MAMREILFRGKSNRNNWIYGYFWDNSCGNHFIRRTVENNGCICVEDVEVIPETVGQYTGLCDKNGQKIFDGDIITIPNSNKKGLPAKVWYNKYMGRFELRRIGYNSIELSYTDNFEVIGNIHENPELLKGE